MTGFKGYGVGANYTVAKNMVFTAAYYLSLIHIYQLGFT